MTAYGFRDFISDLEVITSVPESDEDRIRRIHRKLRLLISSGPFLPPQARAGHADHYARHLLHRDARHRFVIVAMVWGPGQKTPVHDHSTWGVMGIVENELRIVNYDVESGDTKGGAVELRESSVLEIPAGTVSYVLPPNDVIHVIENATDKPTITLHVYGTDAVECRSFDPAAKRFKVWSLPYDSGGP